MLIWKVQTPEQEPVKQGFSWDAWYAKNKKRLAEKRAKRYREDVQYREAALERSRAQREHKVKVPVQYEHSVSFTEAAERLGVSVWVLREWRRKNYFPEPHRRDGRMWFTPSQVAGLDYVADHFRQWGARGADKHKKALEGLVELVYANW